MLASQCFFISKLHIGGSIYIGKLMPEYYLSISNPQLG